MGFGFKKSLMVYTFSMFSGIVCFESKANIIQESLLDNLSFMHSVYNSMYAPSEWKYTYSGWSLNSQLSLAREETEKSPNMTILQARKILKDFIYSFKDYHVSISFQSTEKSTLPFVVKGVNEKYFITYIDREKLSKDTFPFNVGDEIVTFDGKKTHLVVQEVQNETPANIPETDKALAELALTRRNAQRGYLVPKGPITLGIRKHGSDKIQTIQLIWEYKPEQIRNPKLISEFNNHLLKDKQSTSPHLFLPSMTYDTRGLNENDKSENPYEIGARKSYIPKLGNIIWETKESNPFYAYMFKNDKKQTIGYLRIPSYVPKSTAEALKEFAKIITTFQKNTDGLVIDQINNPGGSVFYLYALVSMLVEQSIPTPQHQMTLNQGTILDAYNSLKILNEIKNEDDALEQFPDGIDNYPASYQSVEFIKSYFNFLIQEWNEGRTLTKPYWIYGVDHINPHPKANYTKPILLLVNELDFSGGDFFPAILQDSKRVNVLGTRTSGAGGYVVDVQFPNILGIDSFRVTESIAHRINEKPIENLGITPDIQYQLTEDDLANGYKQYTSKILENINNMIN